ncbi:MAG: hypothetical protein ABJA60_11045 [Nitrosospira sp.]
MLGGDYSIFDVAIAPLLWKLDNYEIQLPKQATSLHHFAEHLFNQPAFIHATTASEKAVLIP